ncbi:MAG: endolytic transglycosylase MltG, partial [Bacteroidota bacterium]
MVSLLKNKKVIIGILLIILVLFAYAYTLLYSGNIGVDNYELKIKSNTSYDQLKEQLSKDGVLKNISSFDMVASLMKYKKNEIPSGRYLIKRGMSNRKLISKLRSGDQDALDLTFNNVRTIQDLAGALSRQLEADSITLLNAFLNEKTLSQNGLNPATALTMYIPNTYDVFWNISPEKFIKRMKQEADDFWTKERVDKIKNWNLNREQAYTLASIVEKESNNKKERPTVAGVYLNRLKIGDKLRAD